MKVGEASPIGRKNVVIPSRVHNFRHRKVRSATRRQELGASPVSANAPVITLTEQKKGAARRSGGTPMI